MCRDARAFPVRLSARGFSWPRDWPASARTAFLAMDVTARPRAFWREPFVDVVHGDGGRGHRQYFEPGAVGVRFVNLSPILEHAIPDPELEVGLVSASLHWRAQGTLLAFDPPAARPPLLVLAPHPDDAEIAAFGLYAGWPSASWVVTITAGERGAMDLSHVLGAHADGRAAAWKTLLRTWDSLSIPALAGVPPERCLNLGYPDGALEALFRDPARSMALASEPALGRAAVRARNADEDFRGTSREGTWADLVTDLRKLLEKVRPGAVVCPHPVVDHHADHAFTTIALEQAMREAGHAVAHVFLYVVHAGGPRGYPFGAGDAVVSVAPWDGEEPVADAMYSHPLSPELRLRKYFAVEAAHDVRTYVTGAPRTFRQLVGAIGREVTAYVGGVGAPPTGFFLRRAARANELYYVASPERLAELVRRRVERGP